MLSVFRTADRDHATNAKQMYESLGVSSNIYSCSSRRLRCGPRTKCWNRKMIYRYSYYELKRMSPTTIVCMLKLIKAQIHWSKFLHRKHPIASTTNRQTKKLWCEEGRVQLNVQYTQTHRKVEGNSRSLASCVHCNRRRRWHRRLCQRRRQPSSAGQWNRFSHSVYFLLSSFDARRRFWKMCLFICGRNERAHSHSATRMDWWGSMCVDSRTHFYFFSFQPINVNGRDNL